MNKSTPEALALYNALENRKIACKLEAWDGHKHIDISIPWARIDIEIDGFQHYTSPQQIESDLKRSYYSAKDEFHTMHIPNEAIHKDLDKVADAIAEVAKKRYYESKKSPTEELIVKKIDKKQLLLVLLTGVVGILVIMGLLALADQGPFKINGFQIFSDIIKQTALVLWTLTVLFAKLFWQTVTGSWLATLVFIGLVAFIILKKAVEHREDMGK